MNFQEYENEAARMAREHPTTLDQRICGALGLEGEGSELFRALVYVALYQCCGGVVAEQVKKEHGHDKPIDRTLIVKELGDALWYVMRTATAVGATLEEVAQTNLEKLRARHPSGTFTTSYADEELESTPEHVAHLDPLKSLNVTVLQRNQPMYDNLCSLMSKVHNIQRLSILLANRWKGIEHMSKDTTFDRRQMESEYRLFILSIRSTLDLMFTNAEKANRELASIEESLR